MDGYGLQRRGRSTGMYNYSQPSTSQYESFFEPIPLEFLQGIADKHQAKYDNAYGAAMGAKDMFGDMEVADTDISNAKNIIGEFTNNMDKMVTDQYGGDWGRASKEIARMVTTVKGSEFWDTSKTLKQRQDEERKLIQQYGPRALQFKSVLGKSSIDPETGQIVKVNELDFDVQEQGDWQGYMKTILQSINPDQYDLGLTNEEKGYLRDGQWSGISQSKLDKIINTPEVIDAFITENPDFKRAVEQGLRYKEFDGNVREAAKSFFKGNLYPLQNSKQQSNLVQDWQMKAAADNSKDNPYYGSTSELPVVANMQRQLNEHDRKTKNFKYKDGVAQGKGELTEEKQKELDNINKMYNNSKFIDERGVNQTLVTAINDFNSSLTNDDYYTPGKYYNDLVSQYPELGKLNQEEAFTTYKNYLTNLEKESRVVSNIVLKNSPNKIKSLLLSNLGSGQFSSYSFRSTGDTFDNNSIVKQLGYDNVDDMLKQIKDEDIAPRIDFREGKMLINIKNKKGKNVDVYFNPDIESRDLINIGQAINEFYYDPKSYSTDDSKPIRLPNSNIGFSVVGTGNIVEGNDKQIFLVRLDDQGNIIESEEPVPMNIRRVNEFLSSKIDSRFNEMEES